MIEWIKKYAAAIAIVQAIVWSITGAIATWHYLSDEEKDIVFDSEEEFNNAVGCEIDKMEGDPVHPICQELSKKLLLR